MRCDEWWKAHGNEEWSPEWAACEAWNAVCDEFAKRLAELDEIGERLQKQVLAGYQRAEKAEKRIAELEAEIARFRQRETELQRHYEEST